ncbi:D-alanyl-D-alanine carboxypeptidase/D-alanyl-D-alanine carboxypeptidase (penicillin-binding protein 5/6) [Bacillus tianshenii]|uniref:D-alanyl-D-alanine carboxypeptidase/D-alanyl-D-alanine carboxypeptidase (Penicillin-binding protein 5/6) n=1 Tax=Sutcliffiella tianshenii TaxID=1463404 RepID=A0ABS2P6C7_9BACI|nr:D-alanyl-D-alanine carboxypeptidase family protein [Bacillus tianshenii]MBM7622138.1 D-alanyl-D-alanine carboxypeptidase/D-alanyl-D-alanine carboxypeptidase (penicillin-binding protein 5/6) [Bacillus tianshenii]
MIKKCKNLLLIAIVLVLGLPIHHTNANSNQNIELFSESAILIDTETGDVLYEKDRDKIMYPASITKIVTAIIAIEEGNLEDIVTVSEKARNQDGSRVYLLEGEKVTLQKLVQGLLINSGNDAGTAIAEHMNGSEKEFAKRMTAFVEKEIGTENTTFKNPHGLFDPEHVTTAEDMGKIARYAMKNETFREIVGTKEMEWIGEGWETTLYNHHRLLWDYEGATGVKNGYVPESGHTLVTTAERNGKELLVVTLKAASKYYSYKDTMNLLDYGFLNFETVTVEKGKMISDAAGRDFMLTKDIQVSKKSDEEISLAVNNADQLIVKTGDRENIKEGVIVEQVKNEITPLASTEKTDKHESANQAENQKSSFFSMGIFLVILFFIVWILGWNQKRRRRKKNQGRFSESVSYARRSKYYH